MNSKLRLIIPLGVLIAAGIAFAVYAPIGNLSSFGWQDIALICPLGALSTLLASKTFIPRALLSLAVAVVLILVFGRAFCGWICPVPVVSKLRHIFKKKGEAELAETRASADTARLTKLSPKERASLKTCTRGCGSCASKGMIDSRHIVLGGTLFSVAIFGFPVFCLICPIGLSFATIFLIIALFGSGDVSWTVVVVPALLAIEVIFFRKWCSHICPLSALMSLIAKGNRTFQPRIDDGECLETSANASCGRCAKVCEQGINPRHPELGASWSECTKCRACVDICPSDALKLAFLPHTASRTTEAVPAAGKADALEVTASTGSAATNTDASVESQTVSDQGSLHGE